MSPSLSQHGPLTRAAAAPLQSFIGGIGLNTDFVSSGLGPTTLTFHNTLDFCLFAPTEVFVLFVLDFFML